MGEDKHQMESHIDAVREDTTEIEWLCFGNVTMFKAIQS